MLSWTTSCVIARMNCLPLAKKSKQRGSLKDTLEMRGSGGGRRCRIDLSSDEMLGRFQGIMGIMLTINLCLLERTYFYYF